MKYYKPVKLIDYVFKTIKYEIKNRTRPKFVVKTNFVLRSRILADDYPKSQQEVMTSCHLYSETRIYCEFRENKSQAANWSKAKPF